MNYWLVKSEPDEFSFDDLYRSPQRTDHWDGVRNYQARNFMRDGMKYGDLVFFYHSNCAEPAIVGIAKVVREAYPDHTAFDAGDAHYDPKSDPDVPRWVMVDIKYVKKLKRAVSLRELKAREDLEGFALTRRGNRLSVMPVSEAHWHTIVALAQTSAP